VRQPLLLVAFVFAYGNAAFALGAGDTVGALVAGAITIAVVLLGIATTKS